MPPLPPDRAARWLVFALAALLAASVQFGLRRPLINDEAIELQQAEGVALDRFYFFVPTSAYRAGNADVIESLAPYANRALFGLCSSWLHARAAYLVPVRVFYLLAFASSCLLFYLAARRQWTAPRAFVAGVCLAASAYALLMNQFLTRNALSLWWACVIVWTLAGWLRENRSGNASRAWPWACGCAVALAAGCWTYTSFKLMAAALYPALALAWLRFDRRASSLVVILASAGMFAAFLGALILAGGGDLSLYFARGSYALRGTGLYLRNLLLTLVSPFFYTMHGNFVEEDVHLWMERAPLSPLLWPFFAVGWLKAWAGRGRFWFCLAAAWTLAMAACAMAGPNLKYLHAFFPITLLLALAGLFAAVEWLAARWPRWNLAAGGAVFLSMYAGAELWHIFTVVPRSERMEFNRFPQQMAQTALDAARTKPPGSVLVHPGIGFDLLNWYLWPPAESAKIRRWSVNEVMMEALKAGPPLPEGAVIIVDYPVEDVFAVAGKVGWTVPETMKVINVRDQP
jgi:hypothetical protein